jgi:hypothetical protein
MREIRPSGSVEGVMSNRDSYSDFLLICPAVCGTCLPNGCAVATHSLGDWTESAEGDPDSLWGRSPHLKKARSGFWKGERASEGRGCFERGTLNADRKGKPEGGRPVQRPFLLARVAKASSETRRVNHNTTGKNDNGT